MYGQGGCGGDLIDYQMCVCVCVLGGGGGTSWTLNGKFLLIYLIASKLTLGALGRPIDTILA